MHRAKEQKWGGSGFNSWVSANTPFSSATARALKANYEAIKNSGMTAAQAEVIGWSKLRVFAAILTPGNLEEWVEKGASMSRAELKMSVQSEKGKSAANASVEKVANSLSVLKQSYPVVKAALAAVKAKRGIDDDGEALKKICEKYDQKPDMVEQLMEMSPSRLANVIAKVLAAMSNEERAKIMEDVHQAQFGM